MLTSDLLKYSTRKGQIYPYQLGKDHEALCQDSLAAFAGCQGLDVGAAKERLLDAAAAAAGTPILAKGLHKLLMDKCAIEEPGDDIAERRWQWLTAATELRKQGQFATVEEFHEALSGAVGLPYAQLATQLFSDLPDKRKILAVPDWPAVQLRDRYNIAQIQGLILRAKELTITASFADLGQQRAFFRQLKFLRLVAEASPTKKGKGGEYDGLVLKVSGPLTILDSANSYGLRLAQFVPYVLALPDFSLEATVAIKRSSYELQLSPKKYRLSHSPYKLKGHVPEELALFIEAFAEVTTKKTKKPLPELIAEVADEPLVLPGGELVSADFVIGPKKGVKTGQKLHIELFHKWHQGGLAKRWQFKREHPEFPLLIGACRTLKKKPEIAALVKNSPLDEKHVIWFSSFPSAKKVWENLANWGL